MGRTSEVPSGGATRSRVADVVSGSSVNEYQLGLAGMALVTPLASIVWTYQ